MEYRVKQLLKSKMVPAVLSIVLGVVIIIARRAAVDLLVKILGGIIVAGGIGMFITYLLRKDKEAGDLTMVLVLTLSSVLAGLLLILFAGNIVDIFPILVGAYLVMNGLSHITAAFVSKEDRVLVGIMGVLVIVLGVMIISRPGFLVNFILVFIGVSMVVNGIMDLLVLKRIRGNVM